MSTPKEFEFITPSEKIEIHLSNGEVISGPRGRTLEEFFELLQARGMPPIVGAVVNGKLTELSFPVTMDGKVHPITMEDADGMRFYRRSLTFLLESAFHDLYPDAILTVDHSVTSGGYFCQVYHRTPLDTAEISALENRMRELVDEDIKFEKIKVSLEEGIKILQEQGPPG